MTQASIALATRVPIQLNPGQTRLVLVVAGAVVLVLLAGAMVEVLFGSVGGFLLRLAGHPPPHRARSAWRSTRWRRAWPSGTGRTRSDRRYVGRTWATSPEA
jgi:hypothetical protein